MTRTLLQSVNQTLLSAGERTVINTSGNLGDIVKQCLRDSSTEISTGNKLENLRDRINASSWSTDEATLPADIAYISGVFFYTSPTGTPASTFDYPTINIAYVTPEEYERRILWNYSNTTQAIPYFWTKLDYNIVKVNPYPTDATERAKILFDVFRTPQIPASDSTNWSCADVVLDLIQTRAAAMLASRHLQDPGLYQTLMADHQMLLKNMRYSQHNTPGGYSMYRQGRQRHVNWRNSWW